MSSSPNVFFGLAALLALATAALHAWAGEREIMKPLRGGAESTPAGRERFAVLDAVWHIITIHLVLSAVALGALAFTTPPLDHHNLTLAPLPDLLTAHFVLHAIAFLVITRRRFGQWLRLPQWTLFAGLALLTVIGAHVGAAGWWSARSAALLCAFCLLLLSALHVYWAAGGAWPAVDRATLADTVVGGPAGSKFPSTLATALVAVGLAGAAVTITIASGLVSWAPAVTAARAAAWLLAALLLLRGVGGFFEARFRPAIVGTPYCRLNLTIYSPLCLTLALLVGIATRG